MRYPKSLINLILTFAITLLCEVFFIMDVVADFFYLNLYTSWISHSALELIVTLALALALIAIAIQIRVLYLHHIFAKRSVRVRAVSYFLSFSNNLGNGNFRLLSTRLPCF